MEDNSKVYVGRLCVRSHKYKGVEGSLRYFSTHGCVECQKLRYQRDKERHYLYVKNWRKDNKKYKEKRDTYSKKYYKENKGMLKEKYNSYHRDYYLKNKKTLQEKSRLKNLRNKIKKAGDLNKFSLKELSRLKNLLKYYRILFTELGLSSLVADIYFLSTRVNAGIDLQKKLIGEKELMKDFHKVIPESKLQDL